MAYRFLRFLVSLGLLAAICNFHAFYEQDQMAKVAQVTAMLAQPEVPFHLLQDYYRKDLFSFFYLLGSLFCSVTGLSPMVGLNVLAVLCGATFLTVFPMLVRRLFGASEWISWLAVLLTPAVVVNSAYANETILALTCATLAALCLTYEQRPLILLGSLFYTFSAYARADYLFLGPLLAACTFYPRFSWEKTKKRLVWFLGASLVLGLAYFLVFIRKKPDSHLIFFGNYTLFASFVLFGIGIPNLIFAGVGLARAIRERRAALLTLGLVGFHLAPYFCRSTSPKYILPTILVVVIFAILGMAFCFRRYPVPSAVLIAFFCFFSVTPFGFFGPARAAYWYLPTDAGPIPTGGYLPFYAKVASGFFHTRYHHELREAQLIGDLYHQAPENSIILGWFNQQAFFGWITAHRKFDVDPFKFFLGTMEPPAQGMNAQTRGLAIRSTYLYPRRRDDATLAEALRTGKVRTAAATEVNPFPEVILANPLSTEPGEPDLARRILFLREYYAGEHAVPRKEFVAPFKGTSWIPRSRYETERDRLPAPIYEDSEWVAFDQPVDNAIYYSLRFPIAYSRHRPAVHP